MDKLDAVLAFVKTLAAESAAIARQRADRATAHEKSNRSFVTDLDLELERLIRDRLSAAYPEDQITGEELAAEGGKGSRRWSIDPIDGTGNMVFGFPLWAVSIGLLEAGEPVLGVISIPVLGELYWATKGGGAWRDGVKIEAVDADVIHPQDNVCLSTNALRTIDPRSLPGRIRDVGSACCEQVFVSCGRLACCAFLGEQTHDVAAGAVITSEAGCAFGTIEGKILTPAEFVAATPVRIPTFVAPPRRLAILMSLARRYPES